MAAIDAKEPASRTSIVVLAAGMSQRMGTPKQLLRVGEKTLLERTLRCAQASLAGEIVLVLGFAAEQIRQTVSANGIQVVMNEGYTEGMGSSLRAGITVLHPQAQAALIMLADQPFVLPSTLDQIIEHHRKFRPQVVIPTYKGFRGNPVLVDRSLFPEIAHIKGDIGCRAIFGNHTEGIAKLAVDDPGILLDVDTREDLETLAASHGGESRSPLPQADVESRPGLPAGQPELVVVGRDALAIALVKLARVMGFTTTVIDPFLWLKEIPEAHRILHVLDFSRLPPTSSRAVVVASRGQFDEDALEQAMQTDALYIGLLANKKRSQDLAAILRRKGISPDRIARMRAPAGLEIGAESPEEIALSILAEIVAEQHRVGS